ncbi:10208_t:CDS:1 [Funneliformis mosseae]|uniref:10208_t:CDS:1 n=1 Tax=Funneliformis mosseae TaxID=27381 RepID=A0A9N9GXH9_FUNMO|nr:10208_t:CDS:1 [Funneliformis mosseae]
MHRIRIASNKFTTRRIRKAKENKLYYVLGESYLTNIISYNITNNSSIKRNIKRDNNSNFEKNNNNTFVRDNDDTFIRDDDDIFVRDDDFESDLELSNGFLKNDNMNNNSNVSDNISESPENIERDNLKPLDEGAIYDNNSYLDINFPNFTTFLIFI